MDVSPNALRRETASTLRQVEAQIETVKRQAKKDGIESAMELRYMDGTWPMIQLLLAKAQCFHTLTLLNEQARRR